jgi:hypothetical protein
MEFFMQLEQELDVVVQSLSSVVKEIWYWFHTKKKSIQTKNDFKPRPVSLQ